MLRGGWGDGDTAAVALPLVPEAAGGLEPRFCLLFWLRFPWRRDLCKRHRFSRRHQGHCGCWGGHVLPPTLSCPQSQALVVPIIITAGLWHPSCATVGFCALGIVPITASFLTATMTGFVTTTTALTKILKGVMASLSPSWSLCPCYCSHIVPTKATLSSPQPPQPHYSHAVPLCPLVLTTDIQAPPQPPHPHLSHHNHTVPTQPCVCLSPWPLCPCNSHPNLASATAVILCGTVTTATLSSPQPPCVTLW